MGASSSSSANQSSSSSSSSTSSITETAFSGVGNLIKLLPTGTVFLFQFLNPVFSGNGSCDNTVRKYLTAILLAVCGFSCFFASFTDSYTGSDGRKHYGIVTTSGLWPSTASENVDFSKYKLRLGDFVHALFALIVFAVLALLNSNIVKCFYPSFESAEKILLQALPVAIGVISSAVFLVYPNNRHGIGYPSSVDSSQSSQKSV